VTDKQIERPSPDKRSFIAKGRAQLKKKQPTT
jgi:hypothetical protein